MVCTIKNINANFINTIEDLIKRKIKLNNTGI